MRLRPRIVWQCPRRFPSTLPLLPQLFHLVFRFSFCFLSFCLIYHGTGWPSGNSVWVSATGAKRFVSHVSRMISRDTALTGFGPEPVAEIWFSFDTPALLTRISRRPYFLAK